LDLFKTTENLAKAEINGKKTVKFEVIVAVTITYKLASFTITVSGEVSGHYQKLKAKLGCSLTDVLAT